MRPKEVPPLPSVAPSEYFVHLNALRYTVVQVSQPENHVVVKHSDASVLPLPAKLAGQVAKLPVHEITNNKEAHVAVIDFYRSDSTDSPLPCQWFQVDSSIPVDFGTNQVFKECHYCIPKLC